MVIERVYLQSVAEEGISVFRSQLVTLRKAKERRMLFKGRLE